MESLVQDLLARKQSSTQECTKELDGIEHHVQERLKETLKRNYPEFLNMHSGVERATQQLLTVKEEVANLRSNLQQVADLPIETIEDTLKQIHHTHQGYDHEEDIQLSLAQSFADEETFSPRCLETLREEIDLAVFEHDFEKATSLLLLDVRRVETSPEMVPLALRRELGAIEQELVEAILSALQYTPASSRYLLKLLLKLDHPVVAYECFFAHRTNWVRGEIRRIRFVGDVVVYARNAATAFFHGVTATYQEFIQLSGGQQKSNVLRWVVNEVNEFAAIIRAQILAVEFFPDVFATLAEVCKACRDHTEPLSLSVLPQLRQTLQEQAVDNLIREAVGMKQLCRVALSEDDFRLSEVNIQPQDLHFPPLYSRSAKGEKLWVVLAKSTECLLTQVTAVVVAARVACLNPVDSTHSSRSTFRPWPALEEPADKIITELLKDHVKSVFDRPMEDDMDDQQSLLLYHNVSFLVNKLTRRISTVLKETFCRERMSYLDHLIDQSKSTVPKLGEKIGETWCKALSVGKVPSSGGVVVMASVETFIKKFADLRKTAADIFCGEVKEVMRCYVNAFVPVVLDCDTMNTFTTTQRVTVVANLLLLRHALRPYETKNLWKNLSVHAITDEDHDALSTLLENVSDSLLLSIQELDKDSGDREP